MPSSDQNLKLYNTLTRTKESFAPIDEQNVRMYVCGPTVYDDAHIGNARPVIVFDVLYRLLRHRYGAQHVRYARNITDVDDKINARAARDYPGLPLNEAIAKVTAGPEQRFRDNALALGCLPPDVEPRATAHLGEMRALIERLVARGVAYVAEDHVLFSPEAMDRLAVARGLPRYGALSRRPLDEMIAGARVDVAPYKKGDADFVLWKPSDDGQPGLAVPAGITRLGRPGWHIECSAMSMATLLEPEGGGLSCDDPEKNVFDIHGGGIDLVFPHHENEVAQSCCAFGTQRMANVWMHNGFLMLEGEKMSKSLGNFVTIQQLLETEDFGGRKWPGEVLRLAMLKTHYRQPIDWTVDRLRESLHELATWAVALINTRAETSALMRAVRKEPDQPSPELLSAINDDLNMPEVIRILRSHYLGIMNGEREASEKLINDCQFLGILRHNKLWIFSSGILSVGDIDIDYGVAQPLVENIRTAIANNDVSAVQAGVAEFHKIGIRAVISDDGFVQLTGLPKIDEALITSLISDRNNARIMKNWALADNIRDQLSDIGISITDEKDPKTGKNVTIWKVN